MRQAICKLLAGSQQSALVTFRFGELCRKSGHCGAEQPYVLDTYALARNPHKKVIVLVYVTHNCAK